MSAKLNRIIKGLKEAIREANKRRTSSLDTPATVTRIDGDTMYVHMDGGVPETPVKRTIDAKVGDIVQVRAKGGQAWATGNQTAPPTDDTKAVVAETKAEKADILAKLAQKTADKAGKTATNYLSWSSEYGLVVSEDATEDVTQMQGGNTRITSDGMNVYKGQNLLAEFGTETVIYTDDGTELAHFGYANGKSSTGQTAIKPYYTLGTRYAGSTVGNYSLASGFSVTASGFSSAAIGWGCEATGEASFSAGEDAKVQGDHSIAIGYMVTAVEDDQVVIGRLNQNVTGKVLVIGNGDEFGEGASNALTVDWGGRVWHSGDGTYTLTIDDFSTMDISVFQSARVCVYGRMCQLFLELKTTSAVSAGHDIFTATLEDTNYIPAMYTTGVGYYGEHAIVGRINANGEIIVRNASASAVTLTNKVSLSFTYILP